MQLTRDQILAYDIATTQLRDDLDLYEDDIYETSLSPDLKKKYASNENSSLFYDWINWDILIITGPAGTGKTQLLCAIEQEYTKQGWKVYPGSFTGRAAAVLRRRGLKNARTIHYYLYGRPTIYQEFKKLWKLVKLKLTRNDNDYELWIIDEASMLYESFLGNLLEHIKNPKKKIGYIGKKLQELYDDPEFTIDERKKIIFCGDKNQLPPIFGKSKPALDKSTFVDVGYSVTTAELTTLIRHKGNEIIQDIANELERNPNKKGLEHLRKMNYDKTQFEIIPKDVDKIEHKFVEYFQKNPLETKYINYTNQFVHEFNMLIRPKLMDKHPRDLLFKNDLIHVTKNNYFYDLWNGDHLIVKDVGNVIEGPEIDVSCYIENEKGNKVQHKENDKQVEKPMTLDFTNVKVQHTETKKEQNLYIINETLNNTDGDNWIYLQRENLYQEISEYLTKFFFIRNPNCLDMKYDEWKKERETDRYNNALFINYSYGITGHKAQGGEWDHVIVDLNSSAKPPPGWMYTAITRASQKVMIVSNE